MSTINTEMIDKLNAEINGVLTYADVITADINNEFEYAKNNTQELLNEKMAELGDKIIEKAEPIRQKIINIFSAQYQSALEKIEPIEPLLNMSISLDTVVDAVKSIIEIITAPYQPIIEFTTEVIPKVLELSNNLQKLASYTPDINVPEGVEIPPLNIEIQPITPGDITGQ